MRPIMTIALVIAWMVSLALSGCSPRGEDPAEAEERAKMMQGHWGAKKGDIEKTKGADR